MDTIIHARNDLDTHPLTIVYLFSFTTAEKRFETLNDLVEDGLIAMHIESNAKDYIDTMMLDAALNVPPTSERASGESPKRVSVPDERGGKEAVKKLIKFLSTN